MQGMEYLHGKKIVHFDLKTANLLIGFRDKTPICKVADFGLSKQRQATFVTGVNSLRGTLPWTAPEVILTPKGVTEKVDVYSFAIVLWELWTGREPFEGMNFAALLHAMGSDACLRPPLPGWLPVVSQPSHLATTSFCGARLTFLPEQGIICRMRPRTWVGEEAMDFMRRMIMTCTYRLYVR